MAPLLIDAALTGPLRQAPGRTGLAILAIALGVALGLAIHLINRSAADAISLAARSTYGLAHLAVEGGPQGFDEQLYPIIARVPGVEAASPVVVVQAKLAGRRGALKLYGMDAFRSRLLQPSFAPLTGAGTSGEGPFQAVDALYLSAAAARELEATEGAMKTLKFQVGLQTYRMRIAGVLPQAALEEPAGVMDIATAQWKFGKLGRLSRVDLRLADEADIAQVRKMLAQRLPDGVHVVEPGEAGEDALRLSRAYRSNLTALALVALFTGGFFIYSMQATTALRRRREFAILHALGVTRAQQLGLSLGGAAVVGVCGAVLGLLAGVAIAHAGLNTIGTDLGAGYGGSSGAQLRVRAVEWAVFAALGVFAAIAGALRPALESARIPTADALKSGDVASADPRTHAGMSGLLALSSLGALALPPLEGLPVPGYLAVALLLIAVVTAMPMLIRALVRRAPRMRALSFQLAFAQIGATARYASLSVASIVVSFSLMVSMAIMVTSFRSSLDRWTQQLLPADVYVAAGSAGQSGYFDESSALRLARLPGVERVEYSRSSQVSLAPRSPAVTLIARTLDPPRVQDALWLVESGRSARDAPVSGSQGAVAVWVNEAAADLYGLRPGESIEPLIGERRVETRVQGIWRDYAHPNGAIVMNREDYIRLTGDRSVNTVSVWAAEGVSPPRLQEDLRDSLPQAVELDVRLPGELRARTLAAFDRTFAVTYLLEFVAVCIGLFGIAAGISAQTLARRGEFGALRHLGMTRGQIGGMLAIEGAVLGMLGVLAGLVAGAAVSLILIYVVNRQSFHWSMDLFVPARWLAILSSTLVLISALIAVAAGRRAMGRDAVQAVREDW